MKKETKNWLTYSEENLEAAKILIESELYNPCLQNIQQAIEKAIKSLFIEKSIPFKKTHNIFIELTDDECDFLDSIYLPSKYPIGSVLPYFYPDIKICKSSIALGEKVIKKINLLLK